MILSNAQGTSVRGRILNTEANVLLGTVVVGVGATLFMDVWAMLLQRAFNVPSANYCLVGRWFCHMQDGKFMHANIADASKKGSECVVGWVAHYVIGTMYALVFVAWMSGSWLARPTFLPAVLFGLGSVLVPYLLMQPMFGLGIAASKAPRPMQARLRSIVAHAIFGVGLYVSAVGVSYVLPIDV